MKRLFPPAPERHKSSAEHPRRVVFSLSLPLFLPPKRSFCNPSGERKTEFLNSCGPGPKRHSGTVKWMVRWCAACCLTARRPHSQRYAPDRFGRKLNWTAGACAAQCVPVKLKRTTSTQICVRVCALCVCVCEFVGLLFLFPI